jgi:hypothetical protein
MTKEQLIQKLRELQLQGDVERTHRDADQALLDFIGDEEVKKEFDAIEKWYA